VSVAILRTILIDVGYNPYRKFSAKPGDYALVVAAVLIALAGLAWAILG
jgi:hypothetical protein